MKFDWERFKRGGIAVHCNTEKKAKEFVWRAYELGIHWDVGSIDDTYFNQYKNRICYAFSYGTLGYSSVDWYTDHDYKIVEWEIDSPNLITLTINPRDLKSAYAIVDAAIKQYEEVHTPQDWTEEEIAKAKELSHSMLCEWFDKGYSAVFYELKIENTILVKGGLGTPYIKGYYKAKPTHNDFFNADIGKCVALCKLTNHKVPDFILDKNK